MNIEIVDSFYADHRDKYIQAKLHELINDKYVDDDTKMYVSMCCMAAANPGSAYSINKIIIDANKISDYLSRAEANFLYFDNPPACPFHDFIFSKDSKFLDFYLRKIAINYIINGSIKINHNYFLQSLIAYCHAPLHYRTVYKDGRPIGTVVSNLVMSLNADVFNECISEKTFTPQGYWISDLSKNHLTDSILCKSIIDLSKKANCNTAIDFGCGNGFYTKAMNEAGLHCVGLDGNPHTSSIPMCTVCDFSQKISVNKYDLVLSLEVGEHIPKDYEEVFLDNLAAACKKIMIISWAIPGQEGVGHVNCQPNNYVIQEVEKRGFIYDNDATQELRNNIEHWYFGNTLMVFKVAPK